MSDEPKDLGARLLEVEPVNVDRRRVLEQEIANMFEEKLTRGGKVYWWMSLVGAAMFVVFGSVALLAGRRAGVDGYARVVWWVYTVANAGFVVLAGYVLRKGKVDVRMLFRLGKYSPGVAMLITVVLFMKAVAAPSVEGVLWVLFGVLCVVLALGIMLHNRVMAAELAQREQMLKLELRVVEWMEGGGVRGDNK
jgi:hypothetical protein